MNQRRLARLRFARVFWRRSISVKYRVDRTRDPPLAGVVSLDLVEQRQGSLYCPWDWRSWRAGCQLAGWCLRRRIDEPGCCGPGPLHVAPGDGSDPRTEMVGNSSGKWSRVRRGSPRPLRSDRSAPRSEPWWCSALDPHLARRSCCSEAAQRSWRRAGGGLPSLGPWPRPASDPRPCPGSRGTRPPLLKRAGILIVSASYPTVQQLPGLPDPPQRRRGCCLER